METITMSDMLKEMNTGLPFSFSFVSYDKQRKKGGDIKHYKEVVLNAPPAQDQTPTKNEATTESRPSEKRDGVRKNPHHFENSTRSFRICVNGCKTSTVKKFHIFLVLEFNGKKLML